MLSVSFSLASLISMLMSIALGVEFELDSLNDPTTHPIMGSCGHMAFSLTDSIGCARFFFAQVAA